MILFLISRKCSWCGGTGKYYPTTRSYGSKACDCYRGRAARGWVKWLKRKSSPIREIWKVAVVLVLLSPSAQASDPCLVYLTAMRSNALQLSARVGDRHAGDMLYRRRVDSSVSIDAVIVFSEFQRQGVSRELIAHMLAREPDVREVSGTLVMDNFDATGLKYVDRQVTPEECAMAVERTPFYRALAHFGFTRVKSCSHRKGNGAVSIVLERE